MLLRRKVNPKTVSAAEELDLLFDPGATVDRLSLSSTARQQHERFKRSAVSQIILLVVN